MSVNADIEKLLTEAEALSAMIHMGEKVSFGQDTAMIDRLVAALRAMQAERDAAEAQVALLEGDYRQAVEACAELRNEAELNQSWGTDQQNRHLAALARAEAAEAKVARLEGALRDIDALDPEVGHIGACSENAIRGLVLRMGSIARAALTEGDTND